MKSFLILAVLLSGCANGVQQLTPEQLRAMNGMASCNYYNGMYGKAGLVIVNADDIRKGNIGTSEVTISPDAGCAVTIKGTSSPKPASAP